MATMIIENVPNTIIQKYWEKIEYSKKIKFPRYERNFGPDEKALNDAIRSPEIRAKFKLLSSLISKWDIFRKKVS